MPLSIPNPFIIQAEKYCLCGDTQQALITARMGLTLFPETAGLWRIVAWCTAEGGDQASALSAWQQCLAHGDESAGSYNGIADALLALERFAEAEQELRRGLARHGDDPLLLASLGLALEKQGDPGRAEQVLRDALRLAPDKVETMNKLAGLLERAGRPEEALLLYRQALAVCPGSASAHGNLGVLLDDLGAYPEGEKHLRQALELQQEDQRLQMNLAFALLRQGRFAEAWPLYEGRLHDAPRRQGPGSGLCPAWRGENLHGRHIIVLPEQGLGDQIQFVRYLAWLKQQGPDCVSLVCPRPLFRLFSGLAGVDRLVLPEETEALIAQQDFWVFLLSLPGLAGTRLEQLPTPLPYLAVPVANGARRLPARTPGELRVGLVWRGNPSHGNDRERSLPDLSCLLPLRGVAGVCFHSLQLGERAAWPDGEPLVDLTPGLHDMADTAAILAELDLLISVDTAVAHLAGAIGTPCWLLLPHYRSDWRWLSARDESPWYQSMRLFRQASRGDWATPVERMRQELQELAGR